MKMLKVGDLIEIDGKKYLVESVVSKVERKDCILYYTLSFHMEHGR